MEKARMAIYALAGIYILIMAYKIYGGIDESSAFNKIIMIIFMILFIVVGAGLVFFGLYKGYKLQNKKQKDK